MSRRWDRIQLTTNFNDLIARYGTSPTVICTLQIFEKRERERKRVCVYMCHSNINDWTSDEDRTEEEEEGDHVKKSSSCVCQSFYYDTVVIWIYIYYKASKCMS